MIPLVPVLALAFFSFFSSSFVILRVIIPILPPHPLSSRVAPKEFGLPNFKSLSAPDKAHIWIAAVDLAALAVFIWEALVQYMGGAGGFASARDPGSAVRLWLALTVRQTCLLVVAAITLLHVRSGKPVSFGGKHWMVWAPVALVVSTSAAIAGVLAGTGVPSLFWGLVGYTTTVALLSTALFISIVMTLVAIRRNLAAADASEPWPPMQEENQPRPSFATEDIDAMKDGSSWITSYAGSHRRSFSAFSFSTTHTTMTNGSFPVSNGMIGSSASLPAKSAYWFGSTTPNGRQSPIPPVPPLPAPFRPSSPASDSLHEDPDPFRSTPQVPRMGSQSSWLTESSNSQATLSAWSFPTHAGASTVDVQAMLLQAASRPATPAFSSAQVLGGYGYAPSPTLAAAEKGLSKLSTASTVKELDISLYRIIGWLVFIWVPLGLALPYSLVLSLSAMADLVTPILLALGITLSAPLLAVNLIVCPLPIPVGLFETRSESSPFPEGLPCASDFESRYKRSGSVTVVEGRRSGDVWISKGDAVDNRGKFSRAASMLAPVPKLSVLPPSPCKDETGEITPPLPLQSEPSTPSTFATPQSENSVEIGRNPGKSKDTFNSHNFAFEDSMAVATRIMTAQRHFSAIAKTMILPPSPNDRTSFQSAGWEMKSPTDSAYSTAAETAPGSRRNSHLRSRSQTSNLSKPSIQGPLSPISPPPSLPLPPTPPKNDPFLDSSGYSFNAVDDVNEIDSLSAKLLPLLIPGLKVGSDVKIKDSPSSATNGLSSNFTFSSPESTSTPVKSAKGTLSKDKRKRHHMSLPSLGIGRDSLLSLTTWKDDITRALASKFSDATEDGRRRTVVGVPENFPHTLSNAGLLNAVAEEEEILINPSLPMSKGNLIKHMLSTRTSSPKDVPAEVNTARSSMATLIAALEMPPSANSIETFRTSISDEPLAESTPYDHQVVQTHALTHDEPAPSMRRSSIVYIKSDENTSPDAGDCRRYSGRAQVVRPLTIRNQNMAGPKVSTTMPKPSSDVSPNGLKRLSLLQSRNINVGTSSNDVNNDSKVNVASFVGDGIIKSGIRPLTLTKKLKPKENRMTTSTPRRVARSTTNKVRAILRQEEVLPDVIVRPPSETEHQGFSYSFR